MGVSARGFIEELKRSFMHLPIILLASGVLYGAMIGMMIAAILVAVIPSWRKAIIDSHKKGSKVGEQLGNKMLGQTDADSQDEAMPIERHAACPNCGCKKFKLAKTKSPWADTGFFSVYMANDRCCKQCGTIYQMRFPTWARWLFMALGLPIAGFGLAIYFIEGEALAAMISIVLGIFIFAMGFCLPKH